MSETPEEQRARYQHKLISKNLETIECMDCNLRFRQVGSHVVQVHNYKTARDYRIKHGLNVKKGMLPKDLEALKREHVMNNGTLHNLDRGADYRFVLKDKRAGRYKRSKQTLLTLHKLGKNNRKVTI